MVIKPLFDKVVIKQAEIKEATTSGIILTGSAKEKPSIATVIAVGAGGIIDGKEIVMQVKVGDRILYSKYAGSDFKLEDEEVTIIRQSDILAIIE
jgi:chaperonin GroES